MRKNEIATKRKRVRRSPAHPQRRTRTIAIRKDSLNTGSGFWYPAVLLTGRALVVIKPPVDRRNWALSRAQRQAERIAAAVSNHRDCRGGRPAQGFNIRLGPGHWYGTVGIRTARVVCLLAIRAPSASAVISAVKQELAGAGWRFAGMAFPTVQAVYLIDLHQRLTLKRHESRQQQEQLVRRLMEPPGRRPETLTPASPSARSKW